MATCSLPGEPILDFFFSFYWWGLGWVGFTALQSSDRWCGSRIEGLKRNRSAVAEPDASVSLVFLCVQCKRDVKPGPQQGDCKASLSHKHSLTFSYTTCSIFHKIWLCFWGEIPLPRGTLFLGFSPRSPSVQQRNLPAKLALGKRGQRKEGTINLWLKPGNKKKKPNKLRCCLNSKLKLWKRCASSGCQTATAKQEAKKWWVWIRLQYFQCG